MRSSLALRRPGRLWRLLAALVLVGFCAPLAPSLYVAAATRPYRYSDPARVPARRVALVLGAGVVGGMPTPSLAERLRGAAELYRLGKVQKLLLSGDNSRRDYDEPTTMLHYALQLGVPERDITLDYAGFSTYESAYRARDIFGVKEVVVVTQGYHLPRAVYTCRQLGLDAVGLGMPDWLYDPAHMVIRYSTYDRARYTVREVLANAKALLDLHVTHPLPTFLGRFEGIR